jgi:hypothetical protein
MPSVIQYATTQSFAGQRASLKRAVVCILIREDQLMPGEIVAISEEKDQPVIQAGDGSSFRGVLDFFECKTLDDLEKMPCSSWTWPPRV